MSNGNSIFSDLRNSFNRVDSTHIQLIIINSIIFLGLSILITTTSFFGGSFLKIVITLEEQFILPANLNDFMYRPWTILTYAFYHAGFWHILGNLLGLYWFGMLVVDFIGSKKLISLYVLGGLAGGISFLVLYNLTGNTGASIVGASGAVYAIMVGAATIAPNYEFFLILIGPVKIKYIVALGVILSYIGLNSGNAGGNLAHLAGAFVGYMYITQLRNGYDLGAWIHSIIDGVKSLFTNKPKPKTSYKKSSKSKVTSKVSTQKQTTKAKQQKQNINSENYIPNQAEIDAILDKISEKGYESLSKEEKQKLFKASKK